MTQAFKIRKLPGKNLYRVYDRSNGVVADSCSEDVAKLMVVSAVFPTKRWYDLLPFSKKEMTPDQIHNMCRKQVYDEKYAFDDKYHVREKKVEVCKECRQTTNTFEKNAKRAKQRVEPSVLDNLNTTCKIAKMKNYLKNYKKTTQIGSSSYPTEEQSNIAPYLETKTYPHWKETRKDTYVRPENVAVAREELALFRQRKKKAANAEAHRARQRKQLAANAEALRARQRKELAAAAKTREEARAAPSWEIQAIDRRNQGIDRRKAEYTEAARQRRQSRQRDIGSGYREALHGMYIPANQKPRLRPSKDKWTIEDLRNGKVGAGLQNGDDWGYDYRHCGNIPLNHQQVCLEAECLYDNNTGRCRTPLDHQPVMSNRTHDASTIKAQQYVEALQRKPKKLTAQQPKKRFWQKMKRQKIEQRRQKKIKLLRAQQTDTDSDGEYEEAYDDNMTGLEEQL